MPSAATNVFYAVSETFKAFCLLVCPQVESAEFMHLGNSERCMDFIEVFSGRGHMSEQLRTVSWQHCIEIQVLRVSVFAGYSSENKF